MRSLHWSVISAYVEYFIADQDAGKVNPFEIEPRLSKFAEFYMNFLTPPEPRFEGKRKYISVGDSSAESSEMYGQLATGFRDSDPELSARLMGAWIASGRKHSGFFGTTLLMIDDEAPAKDPMLGNGTFPGWYSVLRNDWGTENETALWMVNGDFYRDHRHNDHGSMVIYALGAPISVDWGSIYYPHVPGGFMHSIVLPEENMDHSWDKDSPPLNAGHNVWSNSRQEGFLSFNTCAHAAGSFQSGSRLSWRRILTSIHPNPSYPIIVIQDDFDGEDAAISKISTLNLMAEGDNIRIESDNEDIVLSHSIPYFYSYQSPDVQILANMDTGNAALGDMNIEGGQAEVIMKRNRTDITIHGCPGFRKIKIPGIWKVRNSEDLALTISQDYTTIGLDYPGGKPLTLSMER